MIMHDSHLRPDGTTFPPVTPDPPPPPGYRSPEVGEAIADDQSATTDEDAGETGRATDAPHAEEPPD